MNVKYPTCVVGGAITVKLWFRLMAELAATIATAAVPALIQEGKQIAKKLLPTGKSKGKANHRKYIHRINRMNGRVSATNQARKLQTRKPAKPPKQNFSMPARGAVDIPSRRVSSVPQIHFNHKFLKRDNADVMVIEGCDFVGTIGGNVGQYGELFSLPLNPISVPNTRLAIECQLWTKFSFESLEFIYIPQKSTSTDGAMLISHVEDPEAVLPPPGVALATSLSSVTGAKPTQVFMEHAHTIRPRKTDKREYYIWPDVNNEDRLTVQGLLKIIDMTGMNIPTMGLVYVRYKCELKERLISADATSMFPANLTRPILLTAPVANGAVQLVDNGALGLITINFASGETTFQVSTVYAAVFNFSRGDVGAMTYVYFKTGATISTNCTLYGDPANAQNQTTSNRIWGSWTPGASLPANAQIFAVVAANLPNPTMKHESKRIMMLEKDLSQANSAISEMKNLFLELQEKCNIEANNNNAYYGKANETATIGRKVFK